MITRPWSWAKKPLGPLLLILSVVYPLFSGMGASVPTPDQVCLDKLLDETLAVVTRGDQFNEFNHLQREIHFWKRRANRQFTVRETRRQQVVAMLRRSLSEDRPFPTKQKIEGMVRQATDAYRQYQLNLELMDQWSELRKGAHLLAQEAQEMVDKLAQVGVAKEDLNRARKYLIHGQPEQLAALVRQSFETENQELLLTMGRAINDYEAIYTYLDAIRRGDGEDKAKAAEVLKYFAPKRRTAKGLVPLDQRPLPKPGQIRDLLNENLAARIEVAQEDLLMEKWAFLATRTRARLIPEKFDAILGALPDRWVPFLRGSLGKRVLRHQVRRVTDELLKLQYYPLLEEIQGLDNVKDQLRRLKSLNAGTGDGLLHVAARAIPYEELWEALHAEAQTSSTMKGKHFVERMNAATQEALGLEGMGTWLGPNEDFVRGVKHETAMGVGALGVSALGGLGAYYWSTEGGIRETLSWALDQLLEDLEGDRPPSQLEFTQG